MKKFIVIFYLFCAFVLHAQLVIEDTKKVFFNNLVATSDTLDFGTINGQSTQVFTAISNLSYYPIDITGALYSAPITFVDWYDAEPISSVDLTITFNTATNGTYHNTLKILYGSSIPRDTLSLIVKAIVQTNSNTLLAPTSLVASSDVGGNLIAWNDTNIPDTVTYLGNDFGTSGQLSEWTPNWTSDISLESGKLKITDIDNATSNAYPSSYKDITVDANHTYKITVDMEKGTASEVGIFITDYPQTTTYVNENFSNDSSFTVRIIEPNATTLRVYLQAHITANNQYAYHDNFLVEQTESSVDSYELEVQNYYNGSPNSDWTLLTSGSGSGGYYVHSGVLDNSIHGYRARFKKGSYYSVYSPSDTALYQAPDVPDPGSNYVTATVESGTYDYVKLVRLYSSMVGASIYYTTNGTTPTTSSSEYFKAIEISSTSTLKAIAVKGGVTSDIMTKSYTINPKYDVVTLNSTTTYIDPKGSSNNVETFYGEDDLATDKVYTAIHDNISGETVSKIIIRFTPVTTGTYYTWGRVGGINNDQISIDIYNESNATTTALTSNKYVVGDSSAWLGHGIFWNEFDPISLTAGTTYRFIMRALWVANNPATELLDRVCLTTNGSYEPPEYLVISPDGGERIAPSTSKTIEWIYNGNSTNVKLEYTADDGSTWNTISASTPNDGSYSWTTPATEGDEYRIRITDVETTTKSYMESWNNFYITITANPYSDTLHFNQNIDGDIYSGISTSAATTLGAAQYVIAANAHIDSITYPSGQPVVQVPLKSLYDAFRLNNDMVTEITSYNNPSAISGGGPEGIMPSISTRSDWKLYTTSDVWDVSSPSGNRYPVYRWSKSYQNYIYSRMKVYYDFGIISSYMDSYAPYRRRGSGETTFGWTTPWYKNKTTSSVFTWRDWTDGFIKFGYEIDRKADSTWGNHVYRSGANGLNRASIMVASDYVDWWWAEGWAGNSGNQGAGVACPSCAAGSSLSESSFWEFNRWKTDVQNMLLAQRKGTDQMVVGAGFWYDIQTQAEGRMYHFCSVLMGIKNPDFRFAMIDYYNGYRTWDGLSIQKSRFIPLGRYQEISADVYMREFTNGSVITKVYVNNSKTDRTVTFGGSYYYMDESGAWSGSTATSHTVYAQSGLIISGTAGAL